MKLNVLREAVAGKRVIMIDDSIVRGTTSDRIVRMLRDAGGKYPMEPPKQDIRGEYYDKEIDLERKMSR